MRKSFLLAHKFSQQYKQSYQILGLSESASKSDVKKAYKKLAKESHPDITSNSTLDFKQINQAYQVAIENAPLIQETPKKNYAKSENVDAKYDFKNKSINKDPVFFNRYSYKEDGYNYTEDENKKDDVKFTPGEKLFTYSIAGVIILGIVSWLGYCPC